MSFHIISFNFILIDGNKNNNDFSSLFFYISRYVERIRDDLYDLCCGYSGTRT